MVCDILAQVPEKLPPPIQTPPLVYTVPPEARGLIQPRHRLDLLVERVVRMASDDLHIGGPFWNDLGFDRLLSVLRPAVMERGVKCSFYVHTWPDEPRRAFLIDRISRVGAPDRVRTWWYRGPAEC